MKVTNMTSQTLNHSSTTDERKRSSTSSKPTSQHKHTSGNSAILLSDTMVCLLYIFNYF